MRKVLFWLHLSAALTAGVVIIIMSLTGLLLMYEKQITRWADGYEITPPVPAPPVLVARIVESAQAGRPSARVSSITLRSDPSAPAVVSFGRDGSLFLNPYTGAVLGEGSKTARAFFRSATDWHRWLGRDGEGRQTGRMLTGAANLLFLFIVLTGLVIWWPRSGTTTALRSILLFRRGLSGKARDFNWHNVIGFWSWIPLVLMVSSGVVMSYPWANDLLYRVTGNEPPPRPGAAVPAPRPSPPAPAAPSVDGGGSAVPLDLLWSHAVEQEPAWQTLSLQLPNAASGPVSVFIDTSDGAVRPDKRSTLTLNSRTGEVQKYETYQDQNGGRQARTWARFLHTGEALGLPGQTIAGLASGGVLLLGWTGLALAWRRFRAWRGRRARPRYEGSLAADLSGQQS